MSNKSRRVNKNLFRKVTSPPPKVLKSEDNPPAELSPMERMQKDLAAATEQLDAIACLFWTTASERPKEDLVEAIYAKMQEFFHADDDDEMGEEVPATLSAAFLAVLEETVEKGALGPVPIVDRIEVRAALNRYRSLSIRDASHELQQMQMACGIAGHSANIIFQAIKAAL